MDSARRLRGAGGARVRRGSHRRSRPAAHALRRRRGITLVSGDQSPVERAIAGDRNAYSELVRRHQDIAFRAAFLVTRDAAEAEDAAQEGFVKAWQSLGRFRAGEPFRPWLLAIVVNEARNRRRRAGRQAALALRAYDPRTDDVEERVSQRSERERMLEAVAKLREDDQLAIGCRYFLELSEEETADALGWPRGTVKSRLSRALGRLREAMEASG